MKRVTTLCLSVAAIACQRRESERTQPMATMAAPTGPAVEPVLVHAAAPDGTGLFSLGQVVTSRMTPLGVTVFANDAAHQHRADVNRFQHESFAVENEQSLSANASAWHVASAELAAATAERFATHRAFQIAYTVDLDASMMINAPPPGAVYYLTRIAFGHLYEEVVHGSETTFHAGLSAEFTRAASGSIEGWAQQHRLRFDARGLGMVPNDGRAIFARSSEEVQRAYQAVGPDVPIFVVYRSLPAVVPPAGQAIAWRQPVHLRVIFDRLDVYRNGSFIGSANWSVSTGCTVNNPTGTEAGTPAFAGPVVDDGYQGVAGPRGTRTFHPYALERSHDLAVVPGDELQCGLVGSQDGVPIQYSGFNLTVRQPPQPISDRFAGLDPHTEYWVNYRVMPLP